MLASFVSIAIFYINGRDDAHTLSPDYKKRLSSLSFFETRSAVPSGAQSSTARLSSSRDCGENTDNRARSVRMCERGNADTVSDETGG